MCVCVRDVQAYLSACMLGSWCVYVDIRAQLSGWFSPFTWARWSLLLFLRLNCIVQVSWLWGFWAVTHFHFPGHYTNDVITNVSYLPSFCELWGWSTGCFYLWNHLLSLVEVYTFHRTLKDSWPPNGLSPFVPFNQCYRPGLRISFLQFK